MRKIGVVTTSRADYSIYKPLLNEILRSRWLKLFLYVSGTHLSAKHGMTIKDIQQDKFPIKEKIKIPMLSDTPLGVTQAMGKATIAFGHAFDRSLPDLLVVLGDRYEMHAVVAASVPFLIPVAHIGGGVITEGSIDDSFRHSITKMSHLHFPETEIFAKRIMQLGEHPSRVKTVGAMGLDNLKDLKWLSWIQLKNKFHLTCEKNPIIVTVHPETKNVHKTILLVDNLLNVLQRFESPIIFTGPNSDTLGRRIKNKMLAYVERHSNANFVENFGAQGFYSLLKESVAMVGNSSSGIVEGPSFQLPVVNIGDRQKGRLFAENIISIGITQKEIYEGIRKALSVPFNVKLRNINNPYRQSSAAKKIANVLRKVPLNEKLILKPFCDLEKK